MKRPRIRRIVPWICVLGLNLRILVSNLSLLTCVEWTDDIPQQPMERSSDVGITNEKAGAVLGDAAVGNKKNTDSLSFCTGCLFNKTTMGALTCQGRADYFVSKYGSDPKEATEEVIKAEPTNCLTPGGVFTFERIPIALRTDEITQSTTPWSNASSVAWTGTFFAGFRNQMMAFHSMVMWVASNGWDQILLPTIALKNTLEPNCGKEHCKIAFDDLFDVSHWNSHYPHLPRLVNCDPTVHTEFDCQANGFRGMSAKQVMATAKSQPHASKLPPIHELMENALVNVTKPFAFSKPQHVLMSQYRRYVKSKFHFKSAADKYPNKVDMIMHQGAVRPSPDLQNAIDALRGAVFEGGVKEYMTLHARVEPDMQAHGVWYVLYFANYDGVVAELKYFLLLLLLLNLFLFSAKAN